MVETGPNLLLRLKVREGVVVVAEVVVGKEKEEVHRRVVQMGLDKVFGAAVTIVRGTISFDYVLLQLRNKRLLSCKICSRKEGVCGLVRRQ